MRSPSKSAALSDRLTKIINHIISCDGHGVIDGVEFDLRQEELDPEQWSRLCVLQDVFYLPNENDDGVLYNQHALWFPWFGQFNAKALRDRVSKLKPKTVERLIKDIVAEKDPSPSDENPIDRLITFLTPTYFVESGDRISIYAVADAIVGGDHLHEHDRLVKNASLQIIKPNGTIIKIEPSYRIFGNHTVVNPDEESSDTFGSILFRIVKYHNLKQPSQLKTFKRYESEVSTASAIAYFLYDLTEDAWYDSDNKSAPSDEELEDAELDLSIVNEATLLGYLWAKIEFEDNLKPLADIAKQRKIDNKRGGEKSGEIRRKNAEQGWVKIGKIMAIKIRDKQPELSQDDLAFEVGVLWTSDIEPPGTARIKLLIGEMEKSGELPKRAAKPKAKRKQVRL
jgi:hypothetical protein